MRAMAQTALAVVLAGVLVACSGPAAPDVPSGWPTPTATATVTATATATATVRVRAAKGTAKRDRRTGESIDALIALSRTAASPSASGTWR